MKPNLEHILMGSLGTLVNDVTPTVGADYAAGHIGIIAILMAMAAQEQDRAVENHVADIGEMRGLFDEAAAHLSESGLGGDVAGTAQGRNLPLRVSDLRPIAEDLKGRLVKLHEAVEATDEPWAKALNKRIWTHLKATAARHAIAPPQMS